MRYPSSRISTTAVYIVVCSRYVLVLTVMLHPSMLHMCVGPLSGHSQAGLVRFQLEPLTYIMQRPEQVTCKSVKL